MERLRLLFRGGLSRDAILIQDVVQKLATSSMRQSYSSMIVCSNVFIDIKVPTLETYLKVSGATFREYP